MPITSDYVQLSRGLQKVTMSLFATIQLSVSLETLTFNSSVAKQRQSMARY